MRGHKTQAAPFSSEPPWGGGIGEPPAAYSFNLLRRVRIEMPRIFAACVRLPRQCLSVSRIRSRSTSDTVRPTRLRVTCSAAIIEKPLHGLPHPAGARNARLTRQDLPSLRLASG